MSTRVVFQCYWFTVEFGLCRENGDLKAYGAGLLSSFGELEHNGYHSNLKESSASLVFAMKEQVGALAKALHIFEKHQVNLQHIESRPSKNYKDHYAFFVSCDDSAGGLKEAIEDLRPNVTMLEVISQNPGEASLGKAVPWFPRKISDLDRFADQMLVTAELDAGHPGFSDDAFKARMKDFANIAYNFRHGDIIPRVEYTAEEISTWGTVFREVTKLYPTHACQEYNKAFSLLVENCGYREDRIPQLEDVSRYLKAQTGFSLRPVSGFLNFRDFISGLAFRVMFCNQYIRHGSQPMFSPAPDVCHELLGHMAMLADPDFAQFMQELGLASLGASDEDLEKLTNCFWFTIEFGMCRQNGDPRAFGAALLSSFGELEKCKSDKAVLKPFEASVIVQTDYPITEFQRNYFVADSLEEAKEKIRVFMASSPRPFGLKYNAYTRSVDVLDNYDQIKKSVSSIKNDLSCLENALARCSTRELKI